MLPGDGWVRSFLVALLVAVVCGVAGCSYSDNGPMDGHFRNFSAEMPTEKVITICSAYGCRTKTPFRLTAADIASIQSAMSPSPKDDTAAAERFRIAKTLAWMEKRIGDAVGTSADRPGDDFFGNGDPTQMDCVDVATNLTSYLLVLQKKGMLRHHTVGNVFAKEDPRRGLDGWLHYTAVIVDTKAKKQYAVDGWQLASGAEPEIIETDKWYVTDIKTTFQFGTPPRPAR